MFGGEAEAGVKDYQGVVGAVRNECGVDADGSSGGGTDGGGGGYILSWWGYTVAHVTLRTDSTSPLFYAPGLELRHLVMRKLGYPRG